MGAGAALGARLQGSKRRIFVLMSDAECNEGSTWEAVMFAAHHMLPNLIAIIDQNGQQAFGYTKDVLSLEPMGKRWQGFNWDVHEVDGHNVAEMARIIEQLNTSSGAPHVLIAKTTFGKGVSFMKSEVKWHYLPMSDADYIRALEDIDKER
jgi:transketolase